MKVVGTNLKVKRTQPDVLGVIQSGRAAEARGGDGWIHFELSASL